MYKRQEIFNKIIEQCKAEGIQIPLKHVVSEGTFCSNALISVNNSTPYNNLYGRTPHILPSIDQFDEENETDLEGQGTIRHTHRLREISVKQTIEATARARAKRALECRTAQSGQTNDYKVGDLVDFYRPHGSKDASGWIGPATVVDNTHVESGACTVKHIHRPVEIRFGDLRHHMPFLVLMCTTLSAYGTQVCTLNALKQFVEEHGRHSALSLIHI